MPRPKYARVTETYNGKRYEGYGATEKEAIRKLAAKIEAAKRGEETINSSMSVDAWFTQWKKTYKDPKGLTAKSLGMYNEKYDYYIKSRIGSMKMQDVRDIHLQQILNDQAGMSESHVKKLRSLMQQMFKKARQSRIIIYDPAEDLELPQVKKGGRRSITEEEREAILTLVNGHKSGLWVAMMLYTGMRPGETIALQWDDIDFDKNEIFVHAAKESGTNKTIKAPKTEAGVRIIPIRAELRDMLLRQPDKTGFVFKTRSGAPHNENSTRRMWNSFKRELDLACGAKTYRHKIVESAISPDLTPYCLRHTFCTDLQNAGVPLNVAKELMGHADIQTTANIYTHRTEKTLHKNMALLDGVND